MTDQQLETEIRRAFESRHEPSPTLENRVIGALPWKKPSVRRTSRAPRLAGTFAALVAAALIAVMVAPAVLSRLQALVPGFGPAGEAPAYSLGAVSGDSTFVIQRGLGNLLATPQPDFNVLLESRDGGRTWVQRLHFPNVFDGMQMFGAEGFIWSIDMQQFTSCSVPCTPPTRSLLLYRTADGGATWQELPRTDFSVVNAYFLDGKLGWADSSEEIGRNAEVLYATTDGGTTWAKVGPLPQDSPMGYVSGVAAYHVTFNREADGSLRGWYVGATHLYTTTDGGHAWSPVTFPVPAAVASSVAAAQQPSFTGASGVVAVGYRDPKGPQNATANLVYLYVSSDGGATWGDPRPAPRGFTPVGDDFSTTILDPAHVWLTSLSISGGDNVQLGPAVARTSDGGRTWSVARNTPRILQMMFVDAKRGYGIDVSGPYNVNGIVTSVDGGATWQRVALPVFSVT